MKENPCKYCIAPKRHPGCHDTCTEHIEHEAEERAKRKKPEYDFYRKSKAMRQNEFQAKKKKEGR